MQKSIIVKKHKDQCLKTSPTCGDILEILSNFDNPRIEIAMVFNVKPIAGHYHLGFEEIFLVLDGVINILFYEPSKDLVSEVTLRANELIVLTPGIHHRIASASEKNRLCIVTIPRFDPNDEYVSEKI